MKKWITLVLLQLVVFQLIAQEVPVLALEQNEKLPEKVSTNITVVGNMATIKHEVLFQNTLKNNTKGTISFSLKENQELVDVKLSVDGVLKEAHIVEKEQEFKVVNGIVRKGTQPIVIETLANKNFRIVVPNIKFQEQQLIIITVNEDLEQDTAYFKKDLLNSVYTKAKEVLLTIDVLMQDKKPEIIGLASNNMFKAKENGFQLVLDNGKIFNRNLQLRVPKEKNEKAVYKGTYALYQKQLSRTKRTRKAPTAITLFWDASYSMKDRNREKDFELLQAYFDFAQNVDVHLMTFSNTIIQEDSYKITNGDWSALKTVLQNTVYDGGTSYTNVLTRAKGEEVLLFTDGLRTLSELNSMIALPHYIVVNNEFSNHEALKTIADRTKGKLIDANNTTEALTLLTEESLEYLGYEASKNISVIPLISNDNEISLALKGITKTSEVILKFGYRNEISNSEKVTFTETNNELNIANKWALAKLNQIENELEYTAFAKAHKILTDKTIFKVLNSPWDYISYQIIPPVMLQKQYQDVLKKTRGSIIVQKEDNINTDALPKVITGIVKDEDGNAMIGATVRVKYTNKAVVTNDNGEYSVEAIKGDILTFQSLGYPVVEERVGKTNTINPKMIFDAEADHNNSGGTILETIEITTAGNIKKEQKALGYGVATIGEEDLAQKPEGDVTRLLADKSSGVQVTQSSGLSGSGTNIIIRGYTSITGSNQALFVVDGVPYSNDYNGSGGAFQALNGSSRTLDLDPNNIASVTVLKGLAATTLYGSEGRNGVVLITTKTGTFDNKNKEQSNALVYMHDVNLKLLDLKPRAPYIEALKAVKGIEAQYTLYTSQRESYKNNPAYFIDVYEWFKEKDRDIALRVLSNIAEVQFNNVKQLKALAFKLEEINQDLTAAFIYKHISTLVPNDVQVKRNLALAYQSVGSYNDAAILLESVNKEIYKEENISPSITTILEKDYNNGKRLANAPEHQYIKMYNDLRIIAEWNTDAEIDLRVIDPKREECSFENEKTVLGGEIVSNTPQLAIEEFVLKNAVKGDYYVHVDFHKKETKEPTFLKVTTFKNYGSKDEARDVKVIKLDDNYKQGMLAKVSF